MPVYVAGNPRSSNTTAPNLSSDALKSPEECFDFRLHAARRKSQISKFINQVAEEDEFMDGHKENDIKKMMFINRKTEKITRDMKEKKEKEMKESWGKLKLVWKGSDYIASNKPQVCLQELIEKKQQKAYVRFQTPRKPKSPKLSRQIERESRRGTSTLTFTSRSDTTNDIYSDSESETRGTQHGESDAQTRKIDFTRTDTDMTETSNTNLTETIQVDSSKTPVYRTLLSGQTQRTLPRIDEPCDKMLSMSHASTPSTPHKSRAQFRRGRSSSRNVFITKKATGNEESNMFMFTFQLESKNLITKKSKLQEDKSNIFESATSKKNKIERRFKDASKVVPELKGKLSAEVVVRAFISEQFLNLRLAGEKAVLTRNIYNFAIMNQNAISTLIIKHPEILPPRLFKELIAYKRQFVIAPIYDSTHTREESHWRPFFNDSLATQGESILAEVEHEVPLYPNFYKNLIIARADNIQASPQLIKERKKQNLREIIVHITLQLRTSRHVPGSSARLDMMSIMAAAVHNPKLLTLLALSVDDWLDQLTKCLGSTFKSVREETCQILCYMIMSYPLMKALYISKYFDVVNDLGTFLLKLMDSYEESFEDYYIVLAHLMHYTPSRGLLDYILDRHVTFKSVEMMRRWPKLLYYAIKYWPEDPLAIKSALFGKRLLKILEGAMLKPLTRKYARASLYHLQIRYDPISRLFTIFSDKAEKAFLIALGLLE